MPNYIELDKAFFMQIFKASKTSQPEKKTKGFLKTPKPNLYIIYILKKLYPVRVGRYTTVGCINKCR